MGDLDRGVGRSRVALTIAIPCASLICRTGDSTSHWARPDRCTDALERTSLFDSTPWRQLILGRRVLDRNPVPEKRVPVELRQMKKWRQLIPR